MGIKRRMIVGNDWRMFFVVVVVFVGIGACLRELFLYFTSIVEAFIARFRSTPGTRNSSFFSQSEVVLSRTFRRISR